MLLRATIHLKIVLLETTTKKKAGIKFLSGGYNHKVKDWLIAISHQGLHNDFSVIE